MARPIALALPPAPNDPKQLSAYVAQLHRSLTRFVDQLNPILAAEDVEIIGPTGRLYANDGTYLVR